MSARLPLALLMIVAGLSCAGAQPQIPNSAMPGREREQLLGSSPMERYMRPGPYTAPPVITAPQQHRTCRVHGSRKRVRC